MMYVYVYLFAYVSFTCVYIGDTYAYELIWLTTDHVHCARLCVQ